MTENRTTELRECPWPKQYYDRGECCAQWPCVHGSNPRSSKREIDPHEHEEFSGTCVTCHQPYLGREIERLRAELDSRPRRVGGWSEVAMNENRTTDWREAMKAREMGTILRHLYIAMGAATMLNDEELIGQLKPLVWRYKEKTRDDLEGTPYAE